MNSEKQYEFNYTRSALVASERRTDIADCSSVFTGLKKIGMSLNVDQSRTKNSLENWRDYGGSLDRFDRNNWRRRGLYEDLSNATKCGISQVS